jgi:hypothetical protein
VVVRVESEPRGAKVKANGIKVCDATPCSVEVPARMTRFDFTLARYETWDEQVEVRRGMKPIRAELKATFARLSVTSEPSGVAVKVDGKEQGATPLDLELDSGRVRVEVGDAVYATQWKEIVLEKGKTYSERFALPARQGGLKVKACDEQGRPVEGTVKVDGEVTGPTGRPFALNVGEHAVVVETTQGRGEETITVAEGEMLEVIVKLARMRDNGDGTVTDLKTELAWERKPSTKPLYLKEAKAHCAAKGGGWRLPTISELRSLIRGCEATDIDGKCNIEVHRCLSWECYEANICNSCEEYMGPPEGCYWPDALKGKCTWYSSSSPFEGHPEFAWYVSFSNGDVSSDGAAGPGVYDKYVRCVRSASEAKRSSDRPSTSSSMRDNGDGTVTDTKTKLVWQKTPSSTGFPLCTVGMDYNQCQFPDAKREAENHCEDNEDGLPGSGWRLPTISELRSLVKGCEATYWDPVTNTGGACGVTDDCLASSCASWGPCSGCPNLEGPGEGSRYIDPIFANSGHFWFWSSSPHESYQKHAWCVYFDYGLVNASFVDDGRGVRCVRSGL